MTDAAAAAAHTPAPAETNVAPIENVAAPPAPLSDAPQPLKEAPIEPATPKPAPSTRDALRAAREKVEAGEAAKVKAGEGDAKDLNKGAQLDRDPTTGKFSTKADKPGEGEAEPAAGEPAKAADKEPPKAAAAEPPAPAKRTVSAPERFSNDAKAVWDSAPEPVKAEVDRAIREMTAGIEKHRAGAEQFEKLKPFHDMATRGGTDLHTALTRYTNMENVLRENPMKGLEAICDNIGVSLRQVAEIVLGRQPDQERAAQDGTIRELRQTIQRLEQQVGGVTQHFQQQSESQLLNHITSWADGWDHFEVFAPHIAAELQAGARDLDAAYEAVLQKHPGLAPLARKAKAAAAPPPTPNSKPAASSAAPDLSAQTEKGSKSISGAPHSGSDPVTRKPASSIREALKRAAARAG